ncbi:MAG: MBL fold metallo-hydrolase [Clostridia bacterium]|nr:MBL fold metallo-hydrolase [Clostridia bacterium]
MKKNSSVLLVMITMLLFAFAFTKDILPTRVPVQATTDIGAVAANTSSSATTIHFINVGQGDATLILSGSSAVLIDGGNQVFGSTVVNYLSRRGIARLDAVIASNPREDHIGGLIAVLNTFPIGAFYMSGQPQDTEIYDKLLDVVAAQGLEPQFPGIGDIIPFEGTGMTLTTLAPGQNSEESSDSEDSNECSLVFRLDAEGCSALFPSDAPVSVEQEMLRQNETQLNCDILKVASHGAAVSSCQDFIQAVSPAYAVISYGEGSTEQRPSEQLYSYLEPFQTIVKETAKDGTIVLQLQDGEVHIVS